jgi:hypothetical protein
MIAILRRSAVLPALPVRALAQAAVISSFLWLLLKNQIDPLIVYGLELYLSF